MSGRAFTPGDTLNPEEVPLEVKVCPDTAGILNPARLL